MAVRILDKARAGRQEAEWLRRRAAAHLRSLCLSRVPGAAALKRADLSLSLVKDPAIRALNRDWRGKDKSTDVLSFPTLEPQELRALARRARAGKITPWELGDVVISLDTAARQAAERGHSRRQELERLLVHGLLHLLGFDHELSAAEETRMRRWERRLLGARGLL